MRKRAGLAALVTGLLLVVTACGSDDGADVRTIDGEGSETDGGSGSGSGSGSGPGSGSGSGAGSGSASASTAAACRPVGDGGGTQVAVQLGEWVVEPGTAEAPAGPVTFDAANVGEEVHELVVVRADSPADLTVTEGQVDEEALPEGAFLGEVEGFPSGEECPGTFEMAAGDYVLFCNIVETEPDGTLESHYEEGMVTEFTVTPA